MLNKKRLALTWIILIGLPFMFYIYRAQISQQSGFSIAGSGVNLIEFPENNFTLDELINNQETNIYLNKTNEGKDIEKLDNSVSSFMLQPFSDQVSTESTTGQYEGLSGFRESNFRLFKLISDNSVLKTDYAADQKLLNFNSTAPLFSVNQQRIRGPAENVASLADVNAKDLVAISRLSMLPSEPFKPELQLKHILGPKGVRLQLKDGNILDEATSSFENHNFTGSPGDCSQQLPGSPDLSQNPVDDATDGNQAIKLSSKNHFACTILSMPITIKDNVRYQLSFDFKNITGDKAGYYFKLRDASDQGYSHLEIFDTSLHDWSNFSTIIDTATITKNAVTPEVSFPVLPESANQATNNELTGQELGNIKYLDVYFYAPSDGRQEIINLYDNLELKEYAASEPQAINFAKKSGESLLLADTIKLESGPNTITHLPDTTNLLPAQTASFEDGLWIREAADCSNQDPGAPDHSLELSTQSTDGNASARIGSRNHQACIYKTFRANLSPGKRYKLSFDYRNITGNDVRYYYQVHGQTKQLSSTQTINSSDRNWHTFEEIIDPGSEIRSGIDIYLYAPSNGTREVINEYDNIRLHEWAPKDLSSYYLRADKTIDQSPRLESIEYKPINRWKNRVVLRGLRRSALLTYSQKYSNGWRAYPYLASAGKDNTHRNSPGGQPKIMENNSLNNGLFLETWFRRSIVPKEHYQTNNYSNGWWIDIDQMCKVQKYCNQNPDGTYDLNFVVEHNNNQLAVVWLAVSTIMMLRILASIYQKKPNDRLAGIFTKGQSL